MLPLAAAVVISILPYMLQDTVDENNSVGYIEETCLNCITSLLGTPYSKPVYQ